MFMIKRYQSVSAVIINKQNEVLMLKRSKQKKHNPGEWNVVAGHVDVGVSPEEAIIKEVKEELGLEPELLLPGVLWYVYQSVSDRIYEDRTFLATLGPGNVVLNEEHEDYKWAGYDDVKSLAVVPFLLENFHQVGITESKQPFKVLYRNYKGEVKWRYISPLKYYFGSTEYHDESQWLLECFDHDKKAERTYAVKDIQVMAPPVYLPLEVLS